MKYSRMTVVATVLAAVASSTIPARAQAQGDALAKANAAFAKEPSVGEVVEVALRYFRVHPDVLDSLRSSAKTRAWLPLLASGVRLDDARFARGEVSGGDQGNNFTTDESTNNRIGAVSVGAVWDLRELVFNPAEVQVFGLIGVQRDIMLEATRTYYLRKQLVLRKLYDPPKEPMAQAALDMRIDEFTAILDVLTGQWFSRQTSGAPPPSE